MSTKKRNLLLSAKQLDCTNGTELHPAYRQPHDNRYMDPYAVRDVYEAARAKDAELIQDAVDEFHHLLMMRQDELRAMKPAPPPNIMEMLLTQSATAKFYIDFLDKAASAGFKPSEP